MSKTHKQILEDALTEEKTTKEQYVPFWNEKRRYGEFSQWYISKFVDEAGVCYSSCEQYMMYQKAILFNDLESAKQILKTANPAEIKKLGQTVKYFNEKKWVKHRENIVYQGNLLKFRQNPRLKSVILSKTGMKFVEASPYDRVWGIGYTAADAPANYHNWGLNLLGKALDRVLVTLSNENV